MTWMVTGGAGYIGSHTTKRLKEAGHDPVIYDNGERGHRVVAEILKVPAVWADLNDRATLTKALRDHKIDVVMHFAAYAYVGESTAIPPSTMTTTTVARQSCSKPVPRLDAGTSFFRARARPTVFPSACR